MSSSSRLRHKKITNSFAANAPLGMPSKDIKSPDQVVRRGKMSVYPTHETPQVDNDMRVDTMSTRNFQSNVEQMRASKKGRNYEEMSINPSVSSKNQDLRKRRGTANSSVQGSLHNNLMARPRSREQVLTNRKGGRQNTYN